jgi:hypothetical protein
MHLALPDAYPPAAAVCKEEKRSNAVTARTT